MSRKNLDITLAKLETIAQTTDDNEVRVLAQTMSKYVRDHDKEHKIEVTQQIGFNPPKLEVKP